MRRLRALLLVGMLMASMASAHAGDIDAGASTFLDLDVFHTPLRYPDAEHSADVGRYGVAYSEPLGRDVSVGLHGGYATLQVDGEPQPVSLNFDGRYLGLDLRYAGTEGDYLNFSTEFAYTWHDADGHGFDTTPGSGITWYESWLAAGPMLRYRHLQIFLGAYYQHLQGSETDDQPPRILDFHAPRHLGGYLGLSVYLDDRQSFALYATGGARRGVRLVLRRDF